MERVCCQFGNDLPRLVSLELFSEEDLLVGRKQVQSVLEVSEEVKPNLKVHIVDVTVAKENGLVQRLHCLVLKTAQVRFISVYQSFTGLLRLLCGKPSPIILGCSLSACIFAPS